MHIAYFDESGDDGFPNYSSPFFVLSVIYLHHQNWKQIYSTIVDFRRRLKARHGFPVKTEMHAKYFILNKGIYRQFRYDDAKRVQIFTEFCDLLGSLNVKIINSVIVKPRIKKADYDVLDWALTFSVQRIDNDMNPSSNPDGKIMLITDPGRLGKMRKTLRRLQRINYIPSKFSSSSYRREIECIIEDPLSKDSKESYFIQLVDVITYIVHLRTITVTGIGCYPSRLPSTVTPQVVDNWLDRIKPAINLKACPADPYGIFYHPK